MLEGTINFLIIQGLTLAFINIIVAKIFNKTLITGASAFWFGWLFLLFGTKSFINDGLMENFGSLEIEYISTFHQGAFLGFILGSLASLGVINQNKNYNKKPLEKIYFFANYLSNQVTGKLLNYLLLVGSILFIQRVMSVGLNLDYFTNAREVYKERGFNIFAWIGTHLSVIISTFIVIQGINDGFEKMNMKKLFKIILFAAPLFLANATRTFLIFPLINYFASFLLMRSVLKRQYRKKIISNKEIGKFLGALGILLLIFSLIGFIRGGYGESFNPYYAIVSWPVSTSFALESWLIVAENSRGTGGLLTFDWFANFLERIGLIDFSQEKDSLRLITEGFIQSNNPAHVIPRSMIPDLIFDFGSSNLFLAILIITFIAQVTIINFTGKSLIKHKIAASLFIGMFMSIQNSILAPGFVVSIFWIFVISFYVNHKMKKNNHAN